MTYLLLEIPDAQADSLTEKIQQLSDEVKLTPLGSLRGLQPPKPPTPERLAALRALALPLRAEGETVQEFTRRIYAARQMDPMLRSTLFGNDLPPLSAEERRAILDSFAEPLLPGEETAEEMIARIYGDRRDAPREVEL